MPDVSDCSVSLPGNSGQKLQVGQSFPIGLDADLPIYNDAEHLLSAGGMPAASGNEPVRRLTLPATPGLPVSTARSRRFAISVTFALSGNRGCTPCCPRGRDRERITAFVIRLAGVPSNMYPRHCVVADQLFELLPKVLVDNRLS